MKRKTSTKRLLAIVTVLCIVCTSGISVVPVSALSVGTSNLEIGVGGDAEIMASNDINSISYSFNSTGYGATISLRRICSGSVYMELQRWNGTRWGFADSTSWTFTNRPSTSGSKSFNASKGTYRIQITITIDGISTTRESSSYVV
jgi:hypothetical protein